MEIVGVISGLLSCACKPACRPICGQLNYIRKVKENEQIMWRELDSLRSQKKDISDTLDTGKVQYGKRPKAEVTNWLKKFVEIENDVKSLGRPSDAHYMCFKGLCPNYFTRWKRSKTTVKISHKVKALQESGRSFAQSESIFIDSLPEASSLPAPALHSSSAERKKDEILQCIMDPEVSKIGIFGMGGVGKTTIMRHMYNQLKEKKDDFDIVMWVTVSSSYDLTRLQGTIAKQLGCLLSSDETSQAMELHEALRRRRNFVIILDDIWEDVSLQNVGIPEAVNGSKIVWTTRFKAVCHRMKSDREIVVEGLTPEEAWNLFKENVGGEEIISPIIKPIAEEVARECQGLPLALITVGRALRKEYKLPVWRNALQQLKTSSTDQIKDMDKYVFGSLKFSYNWLSSDRIRACFLYCALYPEDHEIDVDELIEYWMAEGLIDEEGSLQTEKDRGHAYLKELKDACMIESAGSLDMHVKMHDLIRDLAINITRKEKQFMVKAGLQLKDSPKEEEWVESLERVSLMNNQIAIFQGQPNCPRLSTLLLQRMNLVTFSDTFFKHIHNLRVLDLSCTRIKLLPDSLSDLVNLHALILECCRELECLPSLAKLHKLRQLKLRSLACLKELPDGLENLVRLRHLDISNGGWGNFPSGALLKMSRLEILLMNGSRWKLSYGSNRDTEDNSTFEEIIKLKSLKMFLVDLTDVLALNSFINKADESGLLKNLDVFQFRVRNKYDAHNVENESMEKVRLPGDANYLKINGVNLIQLLDISHWDDSRQLIACVIRKCKEIEWIGKDGGIVLPSAKLLFLKDLHSFKGLCKEKSHKQTLRNLTVLSIKSCHKLKYSIQIDLLGNNLENLEHLEIVNCNKMEEIISSEEASTTMPILPKLKELKLSILPMLTSICQGKLVCDSLCYVLIDDCPKLKKLPFLINKEPPVGMRIEGDKGWWKTLEWEDPRLKKLLQPFFEIKQDYMGWGSRFHNSNSVGQRKINIGKFKLNEQGYPMHFDY